MVDVRIVGMVNTHIVSWVKNSYCKGQSGESPDSLYWIFYMAGFRALKVVVVPSPVES